MNNSIELPDAKRQPDCCIINYIRRYKKIIQEDSNSSLYMSLMHFMNEKSNYGSYRKLRYDMAFFICLVISKYALKYFGLDSSIYSQKIPKLFTRCHQTVPRFQNFPGGACPRTPLARLCTCGACLPNIGLRAFGAQ